MRILLTGWAGYIGPHVLASSLSKSHAAPGFRAGWEGRISPVLLYEKHMQGQRRAPVTVSHHRDPQVEELAGEHVEAAVLVTTEPRPVLDGQRPRPD